jgi:4-aminobutyrate aminotransferase-like enzyme
MVFIYHRLKKPSIFDFESIPQAIRKVLFWAKRRFFPNVNLKNMKQAEGPIVNSQEIPGPYGKGSLNDVALFSVDFYNKKVFAHPEKSYLNFFVDADNNTILDLNIEGLPLGYNNPLFINHSGNNQNELFVSNPNVDSPITFSQESLILLSKLKIELEIGNLNTFYPTEEINETLYNMVLLNPDYNGNNNPQKNLVVRIGEDIKLPSLEFNENQADYYSRILSPTLERLDKHKNSIVGIVVSPFVETNDSGHLYLNEYFAKAIHSYCKLNNMAYIVDETRSSLNSGLLYGFDYWKLSSEPDYVILRKGANVNPGILTSSNNAELLNYMKPGRLFTKNLDNSLVLLKYIKEENILSKVAAINEIVHEKLMQNSKFTDNKITNLRGQGTYQSFDFNDDNTRNNFVSQMLNSGINVYSTGNSSVTVRSSLIAESNHYISLYNAVSSSNI